MCQLYVSKTGAGNANPPSCTLLECDLLDEAQVIPQLGLHDRVGIFTRTVRLGAFHLQSPLNGTLPAQQHQVTVGTAKKTLKALCGGAVTRTGAGAAR